MTHLVRARRGSAFDGPLRVRPLQALREVAPAVRAVHRAALVVGARRNHVRPSHLRLLLSARSGAVCSSSAKAGFSSVVGIRSRSAALRGGSHFASLKLQDGAARRANHRRADRCAWLHDDEHVGGVRPQTLHSLLAGDLLTAAQAL